MKKFLCDRTFMKRVLFIAIPLMVQQLITVSVNLVDNLMVGFLGDAAIASVAAVNKYYMVASFATMGLTHAGAIFVAQFYGANNVTRMKQAFRTMLVSSTFIVAIFTIFAGVKPDLILRYFTQDAKVISDGLEYINVAIWSFYPASLTMCIYQAMRAVGETKIPLRCSVIAVTINSALNYIFIFGFYYIPAMGIAGAALATLIARLVECALALRSIAESNFAFKTNLSELFQIESEVFKKVLSKAAPLMLNETLWSFGMATLFKLYSTRGSDVMSGFSVSSTVGDLFFTLFAGMAAASTILISTPLGANRLEEARDNAYKLIGFSMLLSVVFASLMFISSYAVPILYSQVTETSQDIAMNLLRVQSLMYWIYMGSTQCYFILRAGGDMKHTLIMDSGFMWIINIPLVGFAAYFTDLSYFWMYMIGTSTDIFKFIFAYRLVHREKWVVNLTHIE